MAIRRRAFDHNPQLRARPKTMNDCPNGCDALLLPPLDSDPCLNFYGTDNQWSQIWAIILLPVDAPLPDDWTSAQSWSRVISNDTSSSRFGKIIVGRGSLETLGTGVATAPKRSHRITRRVYMLNHDVSVHTESNYELARWMQCVGNNPVRLWYYTTGGNLFGGATGILPRWGDADLPLGAERGDRETSIHTWVFEGMRNPPRAFVPDLPDIDPSVVWGVVLGTTTDDVLSTMDKSLLGYIKKPF